MFNAQLAIVGGVTALLDKQRPVGIAGDVAAIHGAEWEWLDRRSLALHLMEWRKGSCEPIEQRIAGVSARKEAAESALFDSPATTNRGALSKMCVL